MPTAKHRSERRARHSADIEESQDALRKSIQETKRLVEESDTMLQRHREEHEAGDAANTQAAERAEVRSLREHAQRCRDVAQATMDPKAKTAALEMAEEYDAQAMRLLELPDNCRSVG
jgi:hypothetical protein